MSRAGAAGIRRGTASAPNPRLRAARTARSRRHGGPAPIVRRLHGERAHTNRVVSSRHLGELAFSAATRSRWRLAFDVQEQARRIHAYTAGAIADHEQHADESDGRHRDSRAVAEPRRHPPAWRMFRKSRSSGATSQQAIESRATIVPDYRFGAGVRTLAESGVRKQCCTAGSSRNTPSRMRPPSRARSSAAIVFAVMQSPPRAAA
jgi:hypothetical protein